MGKAIQRERFSLSSLRWQVEKPIKPDRFDYRTNKIALSLEEQVAISRRPNSLVLGFLQGDEGASMAQCFYTVYYLLHGVVNMKADVINLLKKQRLTFACVVNAEQLDQIEQSYKASSDGSIPFKPKNHKTSSDCEEAFKGVNLKFNYLADNDSNACSLEYRGPSPRSEPESNALSGYIQDQVNMVSMVIVLGK